MAGNDSGEQYATSLPVRGAWIEIWRKTLCADSVLSLPVRGAWIEIPRLYVAVWALVSLPVRGAWIEMCKGGKIMLKNYVAPRAGSVD